VLIAMATKRFRPGRKASSISTGFVMLRSGPTPGFQPLWGIKGPTRGSYGEKTQDMYFQYYNFNSTELNDIPIQLMAPPQALQ